MVLVVTLLPFPFGAHRIEWKGEQGLGDTETTANNPKTTHFFVT